MADKDYAFTLLTEDRHEKKKKIVEDLFAFFDLHPAKCMHLADGTLKEVEMLD